MKTKLATMILISILTLFLASSQVMSQQTCTSGGYTLKGDLTVQGNIKTTGTLEGTNLKVQGVSGECTKLAETAKYLYYTPPTATATLPACINAKGCRLHYIQDAPNGNLFNYEVDVMKIGGRIWSKAVGYTYCTTCGWVAKPAEWKPYGTTSDWTWYTTGIQCIGGKNALYSYSCAISFSGDILNPTITITDGYVTLYSCPL